MDRSKLNLSRINLKLRFEVSRKSTTKDISDAKLMLSVNSQKEKSAIKNWKNESVTYGHDSINNDCDSHVLIYENKAYTHSIIPFSKPQKRLLNSRRQHLSKTAKKWSKLSKKTDCTKNCAENEIEGGIKIIIL